ncbi:uncharacterized protein [Triticum aestivum]|uniref:uncharacterized protein n=1 Tax=Triticum aestivum TaxID=4565 RepID=UPI001D0041AB|nr:uncharacterized protein LOC123113207 [Triticum aestivum]
MHVKYTSLGITPGVLSSAETTDDSVSDIGSKASLLLLLSCSARTPSSVNSNHLMLPSEEHPADGGRWMEAQRVRNVLLKLLQLMDQRCNRCFDDIQTTAYKFSSMVAYPGGAPPPPPFAQRALRGVPEAEEADPDRGGGAEVRRLPVPDRFNSSEGECGLN